MNERECGYCRRRGGEHSQDCPELKAMLEIQELQRTNRERGCARTYPTYRDGRCMGCGEVHS